MSKLPLLVFPSPDVSNKTPGHGGPSHQHLPLPPRQGERLGPKFKQLQEAIEKRRIEVEETVLGTDPEHVLVIETVGSVDDFVTAVKNIPGFEWMGEFETEGIIPDQDFYDKEHPDHELSGRLYMVMSNQAAIEQMLSLWRDYTSQSDANLSFPRGQAGLRKVFQRMKDLRRWDVKERLIETGVLAAWEEDLEWDKERVIRFEVELWYRNSKEKGDTSARIVGDLICQKNGKVISEFQHDGIAYHGMLAELPAKAIREIIDCRDTKLVKCESIMFFRPVGQMLGGKGTFDGKVACPDIPKQKLPEGDPVIALLDGLPLLGHELLTGRIRIDDPDGIERSYSAEERVHGTSMASLIVHGDLNQRQSALGRFVYVRPIMRPDKNDYNRLRSERAPDDVLLVDLIHRSVKRIFDGDGSEPPAAPSTRVINLSIGEADRPFSQFMSPLAKMLDWLSYKYDVLFVVSAGNHSEAIQLEISETEFKSLPLMEQEAQVVKALFSDVRNRRILSPAETINGLTVGSVQHDLSFYVLGNCRAFNPFQHSFPSPISAFGGGYRRAIKPDLVYPGGRVLYQEDFRNRNKSRYTINWAGSPLRSAPPGNQTAVPDQQQGNVKATAFSCGTSNATALISRAASFCYDSLLQVLTDQVTAPHFRSFEAPLLKAMLVHGCSWGETGESLEEVLHKVGHTKEQAKKFARKWMGNGVPDIGRVLACTERRATVIGYGSLSDGQAHIFKLPLPLSLDSKSEERHLTVTLAWLSPISAGTQKYRSAQLWFEIDGTSKKEFVQDRCGSAAGRDGYKAVQRGTVQHEVFRGTKAVPFMGQTAIEIKVNCRADAGKFERPVAYGLVVSLEVVGKIEIDIYNEIRTRIASATPIRQPVSQS